MSTPVVVIGWFFLIPSFLGILFGGLMLIGSISAAASGDLTDRDKLRSDLTMAGVRPETADAIIAGERLVEAELKSLPQKQRTAIETAQRELTAETVARGSMMVFGGGMAIAMMFGSFVGGLIGWLLVMKKKVLQCHVCSAVVPAS